MKTQVASTSQIDQIRNNVIALFSDEGATQQKLIFELFHNMRPENPSIDASITKCNTLSQEHNASNLAILEDLSSQYLLAS